MNPHLTPAPSSHGSAPLDDFAQICFEEEIRAGNNAQARRISPMGWGCLTIVLLAGILILEGAERGLGWFFGFLCAFLGGGGIVGWRIVRSAGTRSLLAKKFRSFRAGDPETVLQVHQFAVVWFREQIGAHRNRTLGEESEWHGARSSLASAMDEARQQEAYWKARARDERENEMVAGQHKRARLLMDKLKGALDRLDARADVLLNFYAECEARIDLLDRHNQDIVRTRELESLSDRADLVIAEAEGTLTGIARSFTAEIETMWQVMANLGEMQTLGLAGEASLDNMDFLVDRVIEQSEQDEKTIAVLERSLRQSENQS